MQDVAILLLVYAGLPHAFSNTLYVSVFKTGLYSRENQAEVGAEQVFDDFHNLVYNKYIQYIPTVNPAKLSRPDFVASMFRLHTFQEVPKKTDYSKQCLVLSEEMIILGHPTV